VPQRRDPNDRRGDKPRRGQRRDDDDEQPRGRTSANRRTTRRRADDDSNRGRRSATAGAGGAQRRAGGRKGVPKREGGRRAAGADKRRSRSSDERNPTRSGTQYPPRRFRQRDEGEPETAARSRPALRTTRRAAPAEKRPTRAPAQRRRPPVRRRRGRSTEAMEELAKLAGRNARRAQDQLAKAADAFAAGREREAARLLRPLRDSYPDAGAVRELLGLSQYRMGQYAAAIKELDAFVALTDSVEQHPVLMDSNRALGKYRRVDDLWAELAATSPSAALVTEGRIVLAGSLADRGRLRDAISVLERRAGDVHRAQPHHLRLWYALADLDERAGDLPRARQLFERVRRQEPGFADVAERLSALG
jgi:tetratricopeptide (TPR) repeat protein